MHVPYLDAVDHEFNRLRGVLYNHFVGRVCPHSLQCKHKDHRFAVRKSGTIGTVYFPSDQGRNGPHETLGGAESLSSKHKHNHGSTLYKPREEKEGGSETDFIRMLPLIRQALNLLFSDLASPLPP